mmetsp:Transcript_31023/g.65441  ORF Transcript_31023/g.65441 Transcript_31023/m.65441 type:complete len:205 (-) Transcript_31023:1962-2576(-)
MKGAPHGQSSGFETIGDAADLAGRIRRAALSAKDSHGHRSRGIGRDDIGDEIGGGHVGAKTPIASIRKGGVTSDHQGSDADFCVVVDDVSSRAKGSDDDAFSVNGFGRVAVLFVEGDEHVERGGGRVGDAPVRGVGGDEGGGFGAGSEDEFGVDGGEGGIVGEGRDGVIAAQDGFATGARVDGAVAQEVEGLVEVEFAERRVGR